MNDCWRITPEETSFWIVAFTFRRIEWGSVQTHEASVSFILCSSFVPLLGFRPDVFSRQRPINSRDSKSQPSHLFSSLNQRWQERHWWRVTSVFTPRVMSDWVERQEVQVAEALGGVGVPQRQQRIWSGVDIFYGFLILFGWSSAGVRRRTI